jgi:hypothetical protein
MGAIQPLDHFLPHMAAAAAAVTRRPLAAAAAVGLYLLVVRVAP